LFAFRVYKSLFNLIASQNIFFFVTRKQISAKDKQINTSVETLISLIF